MKVKTYDDCSLVRQLCAFLERFEWFALLDYELCSASLLEFRLWWHELWVRSAPNHPSAIYDDEIETWYKVNFILERDHTKPTPYMINLVRRWREYEKWFPSRRDDESQYPIAFDYRFSGFTALPYY